MSLSRSLAGAIAVTATAGVLSLPAAADARVTVRAGEKSFQQTFPIWVYSSVRNPDHTAIVNAISIVISVVQVGLIYAALRLLRRGGGDATTAVIPAEVFP